MHYTVKDFLTILTKYGSAGAIGYFRPWEIIEKMNEPEPSTWQSFLGFFGL